MAERISAVLIVQNEERHLADCLASMAWADEVIVVDGGSQDRTVEIAEAHGAVVHRIPFQDFATQRNRASELASNEWLFWIDADERPSRNVETAVRTAVQEGSAAAFRMPRIDYMFGRWIRHGGWYPQYHIRLFRRSRARWSRPVHEVLEVDGSVETLDVPILHFAHRDVRDFIDKLNRYTDTDAQLAAESGKVALWRVVVEPFLYFAYKYVWQQGFRDGGHGFVLAQLLAMYRFSYLAKAWTRTRRQDPTTLPGDEN